VGRYVGGMVLGWKALDRRDGGGGYFRVQIGVLVGIGSLLAMITLVSGVGGTVHIGDGNSEQSFNRDRRLALRHNYIFSIGLVLTRLGPRDHFHQTHTRQPSHA
jgi:hypothetical protein